MNHDELLDKVTNRAALEDCWMALQKVVEFHHPAWWNSRDTDIKDAYCYGCENRCGCYEGDILDYNKWETCPTLYAIKEVLG